MTASQIWQNLLAYSLQIGLLVGLAAFAPALVRLRSPRARLIYWQILLATCWALPLLGPWRQEVIADTVQVTTTVVAVRPAAQAARRWNVLPGEIGLALLGAGAAARLCWLGVGFWRLRRYRLQATPWREGRPGNRLPHFSCPMLISDEIPSPVTFGFFRPVILLPPQFPDLDARTQEAVLRHELLHIERRDWVFTLAEEIVRAVFWFHPAIWWLLGEIQLAREQAVDREVIDRTQAREEYVDALLAIAGSRPKLDLAPAPLFLRKRHLKQRVVSILKEVRMSQKRLISAFAASVAIMAAVCWFVTATFPLAAAPQMVADTPGITVDTGGAQLLHRAPVVYPTLGREGIHGTLMVQVKIDNKGNVADASVISGPEEVRNAVLRSVLNWHFDRDAAGSVRQISVTFQPPAPSEPPVPGATMEQRLKQLEAEQKARPPANGPRGIVKGIGISGLSDSAKTDLLARLPVHEGDTLSPDQLPRILESVKAFDEHLTVNLSPQLSGETVLRITAPGAGSASFAAVSPIRDASGAVQGIRVGGNVQAAKLISQPKPIYPPAAKEARIQGVVQLLATIAKDGTVKDLQVILGHPLLVEAAMSAVQQWVYQPTLLNGNPVEVVTQIDVNFTLSQ